MIIILTNFVYDLYLISSSSQVRHPQIVSMFGYCKRNDQICLITGNTIDLSTISFNSHFLLFLFLLLLSFLYYNSNRICTRGQSFRSHSSQNSLLRRAPDLLRYLQDLSQHNQSHELSPLSRGYPQRSEADEYTCKERKERESEDMRFWIEQEIDYYCR